MTPCCFDQDHTTGCGVLAEENILMHTHDNIALVRYHTCLQDASLTAFFQFQFFLETDAGCEHREDTSQFRDYGKLFPSFTSLVRHSNRKKTLPDLGRGCVGRLVEGWRVCWKIEDTSGRLNPFGARAGCGKGGVTVAVICNGLAVGRFNGIAQVVVGGCRVRRI